MLEALAKQSNQQLMLYCAYGERSAMALKKIITARFENIRHLEGGMEAWIHASGPVKMASQ